MMNSWSGNLFTTTFGISAVLIGIIAIIVIALKGYALWHAAKRNEKWWFIAILVLNTIGILELVYLIFFVKKWSGDMSSNNLKTNSTTSTSSNVTDVSATPVQDQNKNPNP